MREMFRGIGRGIFIHRRALLTLMGIVVIVFVAINAGFLLIAKYPKVCLMCHYMKPYYAQWETSSHNDITCVRCHPLNFSFITVNTLRYWTDNYNPRPNADVPDESCLSGGCHEEQLTAGAMVYKEGVLFDHAGHLGELRRGKKLRCTSCHGQMVQGAHMAVTEEVCFLCHFKAVPEGTAFTGCPSCHGTPETEGEHEGFVFGCTPFLGVGIECTHCHVKVVEGEGEVPEERCFHCHAERTESYSEVGLVHRVHIEDQGIDCFKCHEDIDHGQVQMISALEGDCESCHEKLHVPQREMYMGTAAPNVPETPSRMFAAQVTCDGCHTHPVPTGAEEFGERSLEAERASCVTCHGEGYDLMLDDWVRVIDEAVEKVGDELEATRDAARSRPGAQGVDTLMEEATFHYDFVVEGHGVHNVEYAVRVMKRAVDVMDEVRSAVPEGPGPIERGRLLGTPDGYCMMLCHSRLGVPEELTFERMDFPHSFHSETLELECTVCHSPEKHKMRVITRSECMECHHREAELDCDTCHYRQHDLYLGQLQEIGREGDPDFMAMAEISCTDCHDPVDERTPLDQAREACVACHEEGYEEMLTEWINEGQRLAAELHLLEEKLQEALESRAVRRRLGVKAQEALEEAAEVRLFLQKAQPAHNSMLSQEIFERTMGDLRNLLEEAEDSAE